MGKKKNKTPKPIACESISVKKNAEGTDVRTVVPKKYRFQTPDGGADANTTEDKTIAKVLLPAKIEKAIVEEILRHKKLSDGLGPVSKKMSAKKLTDLYMALSDVGFKHEQITAAMSNNLGQGGDLHSALDWLCLNLPDNELPAGFAGTFLEEGREDTKEKVRTPFREEQRAEDAGQRKREPDPTKEKAKPKNPKADVKNWILQYAEEYSDEEEEEQLEPMQQAEVTDPTEYYLKLTAQLMDAKAAATQAKQGGDKKSQTEAGRQIARLTREIAQVEEHPDFDPRVKEDLRGDKEQEDGSEEVTASSSEKTKKKEKRKETQQEVEAEEDVGMFNLFAEEPASSSSSKTASTSATPKQDVRSFAYSQKNWTGKSPKQFLIDWCRKNLPNTAAPKYHKTEVRGNWKCKLIIDRKKEPPLIVKPDILTETAMEAQHVASVLALWNLAKTTSIHQLLPPPYKELWLEWRDAENKAKEEIKTEENKPRDQFVAQLLKKLKLQSPSEGASTDQGTAANNEEVEESWEDHIGNDDERQSTSKASPGSTSKPTVTGATLRTIMQRRQKSAAYHEMLAIRQALPVYQHRDAILDRLKTSPVVIVAGETGSGKSTQVPQFLLEDLVMSGEASRASIVCTQPRRISATSLARRVSQEMAEKGPGSKDSMCGYQIRMESKQCPTTRLLYCTTGVLLRKLQLDPKLQDISHIIVDEVHERSVQSDFLMVILKNLLLLRRDLRVVLMSATVESAKLSAYFQHCPVVSIPGRTFPVQVHHIEDVIEQTKYVLDSDSPYAMRFESLAQEEHTTVPVTGKGGQTKDIQVSWETQDISTLDESGLDPDSYSKRTRQVLTRLNWDRINMDLIMELIFFLGEDSSYRSIAGAVLVFMPGLANIQELYELLQSDSRFPSRKYRILALHSVLSSEDQSSAFEIPPSGVRKVVIATNIAETGITIPDAVFVIDAGKVKETRYNEMSQLSALVETHISKASAKQRQGRAGRVREGFCFRLYTKQQYESFKSFSPPEILRVPLEDLCLHIMKCDLGSPEDFLRQCLDAPQVNTVRAAMNLLREVGACKADVPTLTPLGEHLAALPVNVRVGKMLLFAAVFGCLEPVAVIAAAMTDKQPFIVPMGKRQQADAAKKALAIANSDHITVYKVYAGWEDAIDRGRVAETSYCYHNFLSRTTLLSIKDVKNDLIRLIQSIGFDDGLKTNSEPSKDAKGSSHSHVHIPGDVLEISKFRAKGPKFPLTTGNLALLKAVLTAGLYPNVAKTSYKKRMEGAPESKKICLAETTKGSVAVHPASVNRELLTNGWLLYIEKVKLSRVFIRDNTLVSAYPLLLFGGALAVQHREKLITVDEWIKFQAPAKTAVIFKELRNLLSSILVKKLSHPGLKIQDEKVIQLMMELIQSES